MRRIGAVLVIVFCGAFSLSATLLTSQPGGGTTTTFPGGSSCYPGATSDTVAGFAVTTSGESCYNFGDAGHPFGFVANGNWYMGLIGDNIGTTSITIDLGGLYSWVGGFMNYAPGEGDPVITAIGGDGTTILQSWNLATSAPISTPGATNAGAFRGIDMGSPVIGYLQFGGSLLAMHDITLGGEEIPEPGSVLLVAGAIALLALLRRQRA